uniref:Uncharacterized protein n=1 Tax=Helicotheca tamesis TaxID=374047 RepID=A0A7S2HD48_9STRA|mmetsp:Transcript_17154/g.23571  ORF Transcript_17154/g.23571 Transcript_17154/m.23571 type:complete len:181 (+) Transcript_17154:79-621(+)
MLLKTFLFAIFSNAAAFTSPPSFGVKKPLSKALSVSDVQHTFESLVGKEFQLEEKEDRDSERTEIWLNEDRTVTIGKTDGPPCKSFSGNWHILETATEADKPFRLRLDRTYEAGRHTGEHDIGQFDYNVRREFWGNIGRVGESVSVSGIMHGLDESARIDCELGYFALIDAASEGVEGYK